MQEAVIVLILALVIDRVFGEPPLFIHPTVWIGKLIGALTPEDKEGNKDKFLLGASITLITTLISSITAYILVAVVPGILGILIGAFLLKSTISWRSLSDYTLPIMEDLENGGVEDAKNRLPFIVGREFEGLDEGLIISASVESTAENTSDGIIAPILFFSVFSLFSLPMGVGAAMFYRAANTLDSMLGYKKFGLLGMPSARLDDILNFIPARITAGLFLIGGAVLGKNVGNGIRILKRDHSNTPSPNAGFPMAAMAGILSVKLEKIGFYQLGDSIKPLYPKVIKESNRIMTISVLVFLMITFIFYFVLF